MGLDGPLGVFADAVLGKVLEIERAEVAYHRAIGARVEQPIGAVCVVNPELTHPAFNAAFSLDAEGQDATAFLHQVELVFARERVPFQLVATPISRPPDLARLIASRGYAAASKRTWMELMVAPPTAPDDPRIEVDPAEDVRAWAQTAAEGLEAPMAIDLLARLAEKSRRAPGHKLLSATYLGESAGACEVAVDDGIAVIRRIAVKRAYRPREVARALLHSACEAAYANDAFRIIVRVFQGAGAEPLFESYGFVGMQISEEFARELPPFLLD